MHSSENTVLAYAAGFFDGEGSVVIGRQKNSFSLNIRITSTDYLVMEWMKKNFGGHIGIQKPNRNVKFCRPCWYWIIQSRSAAAFLSKIAPFLVIKKDQADLAIEFQFRIGVPSVNRLTLEEIEIRETYKRRLVELKVGCSAEMREGLFDPPYMAGLLDGEGTILIYKVRNCYLLSVRIVNTDFRTLERMKSLFGGDISIKRERNSIRTRPCWTWQIQGPKGCELLVELYPHLLLKKEQARLALEFQDRKVALQREDASKEKKIKLGEEYKQKISDLNRRMSSAVPARP